MVLVVPHFTADVWLAARGNPLAAASTPAPARRAPSHCSRRDITACDKRWAQTRTRTQKRTRGDSSVNGMACGQDIRNWHPCVAHLNGKIYPTKPSCCPTACSPPSLPSSLCITLILFAEIIFCRCFRCGWAPRRIGSNFHIFYFWQHFCYFSLDKLDKLVQGAWPCAPVTLMRGNAQSRVREAHLHTRMVCYKFVYGSCCCCCPIGKSTWSVFPLARRRRWKVSVLDFTAQWNIHTHMFMYIILCRQSKHKIFIFFFFAIDINQNQTLKKFKHK